MKLLSIAFVILLCINSVKVVCGYYGYPCYPCECPECQYPTPPARSSSRREGQSSSKGQSSSASELVAYPGSPSSYRSSNGPSSASSSPYSSFSTFRSGRGPPSSSSDFKTKLMALINNMNENNNKEKENEPKGGSHIHTHNHNAHQSSSTSANNQPINLNNGNSYSTTQYNTGEQLPQYNMNGAPNPNYNIAQSNYNPSANQYLNYNNGQPFVNNGAQTNSYSNAAGIASPVYTCNHLTQDNQLQPQIYDGSGLPSSVNRNNGYNDAGLGLMNAIKSVNDIGSPRSIPSDANTPLTNIYDSL